jgi:hypothetical protein
VVISLVDDLETKARSSIGASTTRIKIAVSLKPTGLDEKSLKGDFFIFLFS